MKKDHFESDRLKTLSSYQIMDTAREKDYDELAELAKLICNTPIAMITFLDDNRQWFKSCFGLGIKETSREVSFCQYTIMDDEILEIKDARNHPIFKENPLVTKDPNIRFYAGAPLITPLGYRLGSICVIDRQPRELTIAQRQALVVLSRAVMTNLELRREHQAALSSTEKLSQLNKQLNQANSTLERNKKQLEENIKEINYLHIKEKEQSTIFKHFIENAQDCIFNIDTTFCFSYANPTTEQITGYSLEELQSIQYWKIIQEDHQNKVREFFRDQIKNQVRDSYLEFPIVSKSGKELYLGQKVKIEYENGKFKNVKAIARDITEKYEAEIALLDKEKLLEDTHEMAQMGGWEFLIFTGELILTKECYNILHLGEENSVSIKIIQQMSENAEWVKLENAFTRIRNTGEPIQLEIGLNTKSNKKIWLKVHGKLKYKNSLPYKIAGFIQDITQQKQLEDERKRMLLRLTTIIENINAAILLENEHRKIVLVNFRFCELFSIPVPPQKMIGMDCSDAAENSRHLMQHPEVFVKSVNEILKNKLPVYNEEVYFTDGKITERDYIPLFIGSAYVGHLWMYRDVTWKKKNEMELTQAKKEAEQGALVKENFLSTMSHEIRTPLNAVLGITQLLMKQKPLASQQKHLDLLKFSADNLMALINDILDYSKIESDKLQLENCDFELPVLLQSIISTFEYKAQEKNVELNLHMEESIPKVVIGDQVRLGQVLTNLISNAIKFTNEGHITVSLISAGNGIFTFKVIDTGIGIDHRHLQKIFDRFTQADEGINRQYGGTGLGLAISKKLIEMMNGELKVSSEVGKGSCFEFQILLPAAESEIISEDNSKSMNDIKHLGLKILVVEDNEINMFVAVSFLEMLGVSVEKAVDGAQGLKKMLNNKYDLVLLDLQMPELHGYEVVAEVRARQDSYLQKLPIVALTATSSPNLKQEVQQKGMNDFLSKPFELEALQQVILNNVPSQLYPQE